MSKAVLCALVMVTLPLPGIGQWQRIVSSAKVEFTDVPSPYPLRRFTADPFLRDDGQDFCPLCTPERSAQAARKYTIRGVVKLVGVLAGYRIVDAL